MRELLLLLIPLPGPLSSHLWAGEPRLPGQGSGIGLGETPGVPAQGAEAGRGLLHGPMGEYSPVKASSSGFAERALVRSAVLPQCLCAWVGGYSAYIFNCKIFLRGGYLEDQQGRGAALSPAAERDRTGVPGGSSSTGGRGRPCPSLPFPGPAGAAGPAAGARGRCGRGARSGGSGGPGAPPR